MRYATRVPPLDDSPVPGVIPGTVHVHNEPDHAARAKRPRESAPRPRPSLSRLRRAFGRGHRS